MRVGLLGGTFDPIHRGHLGAAEAAIECADLDQVVFIPSAHPPHRPPAIAPAEHRLAMCKLAVRDDARFAVSDVELRRSGPSYTVDTLLELRRTDPKQELFLILGWDAAALFRSWRRPEQVRALATIVIVARPGVETPTAAELASAGIEGPGVVMCLKHTPGVSGSEVRRDVANGRSIADKVPPGVARYIADHHLYAGSSP